MYDLVIISPGESLGYIGFMSIAPRPLPYVFTCVHNNSKMLSRISFKLGTLVFGSGEEPYFKVTLNS